MKNSLGGLILDKRHLAALCEAPWFTVLLGASAGYLLGYWAWAEARSPLVAAVLPLLIAMSVNRWQAVAIGTFYVFAVSRGLPVIGELLHQRAQDGVLSMPALAIGTAVFILQGVAGGLAWSIGWTKSKDPFTRAGLSVLAWVAALLLAQMLVIPGHTVFAWGFITPGWRWIGVVASVVAPAAALWCLARDRRYANVGVVGIALIAAAFSSQYTPMETRYVNDIVGVDTKWGAHVTPQDQSNRVRKIGSIAQAFGKEDAARVLVFPQAILGTYEPSLYSLIDTEILSYSKSKGQTVVVGAEVIRPRATAQSSAIAFYPDARSATVAARCPVPYVTHWVVHSTHAGCEPTRSSTLPLKDGVSASFVFSGEALNPLMALGVEAREDFVFSVYLSNTATGVSPGASLIQLRHIESMSRLFGRALVKAENGAGELKGYLPGVN